jgi:hypothetical protein
MCSTRMFGIFTAPTISKTPAVSTCNPLAPDLILDATCRTLGFKLQDLVFYANSYSHTHTQSIVSKFNLPPCNGVCVLFGAKRLKYPTRNFILM